MLKFLRRRATASGSVSDGDVTTGPTSEGEGRGDGLEKGGPAAGRRSFILSRYCRPLAVGLVAAIASLGLAAFALPDPSPQMVVEVARPNVFYAFPTFIADLQPGKLKAHYVKMTINVEVAPEDRETLTTHHEAIRDGIQMRLRDYRREELEGEDGARRLRADMLAIVNAKIAPARAENVLYEELIVD